MDMTVRMYLLLTTTSGTESHYEFSNIDQLNKFLSSLDVNIISEIKVVSGLVLDHRKTED